MSLADQILAADQVRIGFKQTMPLLPDWSYTTNVPECEEIVLPQRERVQAYDALFTVMSSIGFNGPLSYDETGYKFELNGNWYWLPYVTKAEVNQFGVSYEARVNLQREIKALRHVDRAIVLPYLPSYYAYIERSQLDEKGKATAHHRLLSLYNAYLSVIAENAQPDALSSYLLKSMMKFARNPLLLASDLIARLPADQQLYQRIYAHAMRANKSNSS